MESEIGFFGSGSFHNKKRVRHSSHPSSRDTTPFPKDETKRTPFGAHLRFCVFGNCNVVFYWKTAAEATLFKKYLSYYVLSL
jgi:hypothetical protein